FIKYKFSFGFGLALLVTVVTLGVLYLFNQYLLGPIFGVPVLRLTTMMIVALGVNLFILNWYLKRNMIYTARGIVTFAIVFAAYMIYQYFGVDMGLRKE